MSAGKKSRTGDRVQLKQVISHEVAVLERSKKIVEVTDTVVKELVAPPVIVPPIIAPVPVIADEKPQPPKPRQIGDVMLEGHRHAGRIYGGVSRTTGKSFYIAAQDSGVMRWKEALKLAAGQGARVPSAEELDQIHAIRNSGALTGTFNQAAKAPESSYWSSTPDTYYYSAHARNFNDGKPALNLKGNEYSVRLIWG